jgi:hypothetical protein
MHFKIHEHELGTYLMPPDRRLFPSGATGAPTAPARARTPRRRSLPMEEHAGWRVARHGMDAHAGGHRTARLCRHQMAAGSPACTSTSPPLTKHGAVATVVGEARERTLRQRARPPRRDGGRGRALLGVAGVGTGRRLSLTSVGVSPHWRLAPK